jgi:hypothetical protein
MPEQVVADLILIAFSLVLAVAVAMAVLLTAHKMRELATKVHIARTIQQRWAKHEPGYRPQPLPVLVYRILKGDIF